MRLIALYPILFESHQYKVGDVLPASNEGMVEAWLKAGTAKWEKDKLQEPEDDSKEETNESKGSEEQIEKVEEPAKEDSCTGATESGEDKNDSIANETKVEKEAIGRSAKNTTRKKEDK